ncbi:hypothetical protein A6P54_02605 [Bacillus sp. MKU004]|nr:hypothetical protein A6P54_02605 [Bacillus sp. MKU004]
MSLDLRRDKLEKAKGMSWIIYILMFFVSGIVGTFHFSIGEILFAVQFLGGFLWLPKIYGKIFSRLANGKKLANIENKINDVCIEFTNKTGIYDEYITEYSLNKLKRYIASGRANTLKEAYNLLEDEMYKEVNLSLLKS